MRIIILLLVSFSIFLAGCGSTDSADSTATSNENVKDLIYSYSTGENTEGTAVVNATELLITDESNNQVSHELPEDEFYVSIAPFFSTTHP
ncbi:hypothetical protein FLK61_24680 [Paenalkalicoccus suaedae]|uniref:Uncharacterized protein n=1 Tax=Paenalkalicoccus suaedae TaxID=2592382 RepID=A0A859FCI3_9BACI|nr:hypothetical protein [Paenalkalicoccus suaedae]QKS69975.1 hypothetical protein FLK61_24680 [Paenalkalicoccus suaedae]